MLRSDGVHSDGEGVKKHTLEWGLCDPDEEPDYRELAARLATSTVSTDQEKSRPLLSVSKVRNVKKGKPRLPPTPIADMAKQKTKTPTQPNTILSTLNNVKTRKPKKNKSETTDNKFDSDAEADDEKERTKDEERIGRSERGGRGECEPRARSPDNEKEKTKEKRTGKTQTTPRSASTTVQNSTTTTSTSVPPPPPPPPSTTTTTTTTTTATTGNSNSNVNVNAFTPVTSSSSMTTNTLQESSADTNTTLNTSLSCTSATQLQYSSHTTTSPRNGPTGTTPSAGGGSRRRQRPKQTRSTSVAQLKKKTTQPQAAQSGVSSTSSTKSHESEWRPLTVNEWLTSLGVSASCRSVFAMHHITLDLLSVLTERDLDAMGINIIGDRLKVLRGLQQWRDKIIGSSRQQHHAKTPPPPPSSSDTTSASPNSVTSSSLSCSSHSSSLLLPLSESVVATSTTPHSPSSSLSSSTLLTDNDPNKTELSSTTPPSSNSTSSESLKERDPFSQLLADVTLLHTLHTQYCLKFNELFERINRQIEVLKKEQKTVSRLKRSVSNVGSNSLSAGVAAAPPANIPLQSSNYFVSLRINNKEIQKHVSEIQTKLKEIFPGVAKYLLPVEQLHFTLARLALHTPEQIEAAKQILNTVVDDVYRNIYKGKPMSVTFKGLSNYGDNVIFIEVEKGENRDLLTEFGSAVFEHFRSANLTSKDSFRFLPAAPILRTKSKGSAGKKKLLPLTQTHPKFLSTYDNTILGVQTFTAVEISDHISKLYDKDGYYKPLYIKELPKM